MCTLLFTDNAPCWLSDSVLEDAGGTVYSQRARDRLRGTQGMSESSVSECQRDWARCSKYRLQVFEVPVKSTTCGRRPPSRLASSPSTATMRDCQAPPSPSELRKEVSVYPASLDWVMVPLPTRHKKGLFRKRSAQQIAWLVLKKNDFPSNWC